MPGTIELGGVVYPLVAGKYKRTWAVPAPAAPPTPGKVTAGREAITAFGGGMRRAFRQGSGDGGSWPGVGVGPALGGQGVEPWPAVLAYVDSGFALPSVATPIQSAVVGNRVYLAVGRYLFRSVVFTNGTWANWQLYWDFGAGVTITALAPLPEDKLLIGFGPGADAYAFDPAGPSVAVWRVGERVTLAAAYGAHVMYAPKVAGTAGGKNERVKISLTKYNGAAAVDERLLDADIVRLAPHAGRVALATRRSLYLFGGRPDPGRPDDAATPNKDETEPPRWIGEPEPVFSHGTYTSEDDFAFLQSFQGKLWTWLGDRIQSWDGSPAGWKREPVEGRRCHGGAVAAGWLAVAVDTPAGEQELWLTDGTTWWRAAVRAAGGAGIWPVALYGAGDRDLAVFRHGSTTYDLVRLRPKSAAVQAYAEAGEWVSPVLDGGDRAEARTWGAVGCWLGAPEGRGNPAGTDQVTVRFWTSTDFGATWVQHGALTVGRQRLGPLMLGNLGGFVGRGVQLKVSWESVTDWAPVLHAAWADWTVTGPTGPGGTPAVAKRRWELAVRVSDLAPETGLSGDQLSIQLWALAEQGLGVSFKDVDYAVSPAVRTVKVERIEEEWGPPGTVGATPREAVIRLVLAEV